MPKILIMKIHKNVIKYCRKNMLRKMAKIIIFDMQISALIFLYFNGLFCLNISHKKVMK